MGNDIAIINESCAPHLKGSKYAVLQKLFVRVATDLLNNQAEQVVIGVRVAPLGARFELQRTLFHRLEEVLRRGVRAELLEKGRDICEVLDAGGVREQVSD